jgi:predicted TIM-barrel fold metal-dependent hydrolase
MTEPIIDAWMQHPTPGFINQPIFETIRRWTGVDAIPDDFPLEVTLGALDAAGVSQALVSAWWGPVGPIIGNDQVAAWVRTAPGRLFGVASVDLRRPMDAVRELRRCVMDLGFLGVRVLPWLWDLPPDDRRYYPIYAECIDLSVPFCLQVGHTGPLMPSEPGRPIPYLDRVALDFPELVIVGGHTGWPWTAEMVALATKYPNVYIDTSAYKPKRYPQELVEFMRGHGRKKVLFGTNYPMLFPQDCVGGVSGLGLDEDVRRLFLWENARRVFRVPVR